MPIYEYRCADCRKKTTIVTLSVNKSVDPVCSHCGGRRMAKLISRVAVLTSEGSRLERLADPSSLAGLDENDPQSVARWMKRMGREMGEEAGEGLDEDLDQAMDDAARAKEAAEDGESGGGEGEDL